MNPHLLITYASDCNFSAAHVIPTTKDIQCGMDLSYTRLHIGLSIHCHPISIVTRNRVTMDFNCHSKSSDNGFQLPPNVDCHWISRATSDALTLYYTTIPQSPFALTSHCHLQSTDTQHTFNRSLLVQLFIQ